MFKSAKEEKKLIELFISAEGQFEENNYREALINYLDSRYKKDIERVIRSKYVLKTEDAYETAKDLYSSAIEIFIKKINENRSFLQDINYQAYIIGIARNLFLEKIRKHKEIPTGTIPDYQLIDEELSTVKPFESELIQKKVESALIKYFIDNNLHDCLKILYYSWKKDLKNNEIATILQLNNSQSADASRRVTVIQQNCIKKAWRNIPVLEEVKNEFHIRHRSKHVWQ